MRVVRVYTVAAAGRNTLGDARAGRGGSGRSCCSAASCGRRRGRPMGVRRCWSTRQKPTFIAVRPPRSGREVPQRVARGVHQVPVVVAVPRSQISGGPRLGSSKERGVGAVDALDRQRHLAADLLGAPHLERAQAALCTSRRSAAAGGWCHPDARTSRGAGPWERRPPGWAGSRSRPGPSRSGGQARMPPPRAPPPRSAKRSNPGPPRNHDGSAWLPGIEWAISWGSLGRLDDQHRAGSPVRDAVGHAAEHAALHALVADHE